MSSAWLTTHHSYATRTRKTDGAVLIEAAIAIPLLLLVLAGLIELASFLVNYIRVDAVASEAVRFAATCRELKGGESETTIDAGKQLIRNRIDTLLEAYGFSGHHPPAEVIKENNLITLKIVIAHDTFFPLQFPLLEVINVTKVAPYLLHQDSY